MLMKKIKALRRSSTKASKVGSKPFLLELSLVNIQHRNSVTLEPDLLSS